METRILVVDDEPALRSYLKTALERTPGFQVDVAPDAQAALALFRQLRHSIVLTDFRLPGQNGLDLLRTIRQERPETAVIMITGAATTEEALQGMRLGAVDVLLKPVSLAQLAEAMQKATSRRQGPVAEAVDTALPLLTMREKAVRQLERDYLVRVLTEERGHLGATARRAGVNAKTLYEKMRAYGLRKEDFRRRGGFARHTASSSSPSSQATPSTG
ncbi:MAG TPA: response regulator [Planctomycetaceae bacterium]